MEEYLDHFCHSEHLLTLSKEAAGLDESGNAIVCCVCNSPIDDDVNSSSTFYQCAPCHVYIHKLCAETLDHRSHPEHPLSLSKLEARLDESGNGVVCYHCDIPIGDGDDDNSSSTFYECAPCQFYLHKDCAEVLLHGCHFEHLLCLAKEARLDESGNGVVCYGCNTPIGDVNPSTFYECAACQVYLHKRCAEAPLEIIHSKHKKHPLTLYSTQPYKYRSTCICYVCQRQDWKWFTYQCSQCLFAVDIICAFKDMDIIRDVNEDRSLKHDGHEHWLTLQQRPALLHCDGCQTKGEDYSYSCNTCNFWIHKKCALLPKTMDLLSHQNHTLDLAYSFPESHLNYTYNCDICNKLLGHTDWMYYCGLCRYFVHLNCAIIKSNSTPEPETQSVHEDYEKIEKFPTNGDRLANLIREFSEKMSLEEEKEIDHWYHTDHPLLLWDGQSNNKSDIVYDGMLCAACMLPITSPFYHCSDSKCSYYIHRYCALLPLELPQHEAHDLDHPFKLYDGASTMYLNCFQCELCGKCSSGFFYFCLICGVKFDIQCISLPTKVLHNSHRHPLITTRNLEYECKACSALYKGNSAYQCEPCAYVLDYNCVTRYPQTLTHDYDEHDIYLAYSPVENPSDYYCEICEEDIHPKIWMYCCKVCRFYFHVDCICDPYLNVKFGSTHKLDSHPHLLTFVPSGGNSPPCLSEDCADDEDKRSLPLLKCKECGFTLCLKCAINRMESSDEEVDDDREESSDEEADDDREESSDEEADDDHVESSNEEVDDDHVESSDEQVDDDHVESSDEQVDDDRVESSDEQVDDDHVSS